MGRQLKHNHPPHCLEVVNKKSGSNLVLEAKLGEMLPLGNAFICAKAADRHCVFISGHQKTLNCLKMHLEFF